VKFAPTVAHVSPADRIELIARRALDNPGPASAAVAWYETSGAFCADVGARHGLTRETVAGFVAALSPQNGWDDQVRWTEKQIVAGLAALDASGVDLAAREIPGPGFRSNKAKAARILAGESPADVLSGPKVRAFWANLCGDLSPVTVDRHAIVIAWGENAPASLTAKRYAEAASAYAEAASRLGLAPAEVQALTWCAHRDTLAGCAW
jgi:hypothetical protein